MPDTQTVASLRAFARTYYELDSSDLPDVLVDRWISEGWGKIVRYRPNWPGFQTSVNLAITANVYTYTNPLRDIESIEGPNHKLFPMSMQEAERGFIHNGVRDPAGVPRAYSVWGTNIILWPAPLASGSYAMRGQKIPTHPLNGLVTAPIDLPHPDASEMLTDWVLYRASVREAEDGQAQQYLDSFSQGMQLLAKDETGARSFTPIVLNSVPGHSVGINYDLPDRLRYADGWE